MKIKILCVFLILFTACKRTDNFYELERFFETDKELYRIGEEFKLTVILKPNKKEKEIRFFKNFKNLEIWFEQYNETIKDKFSIHTSENLIDTEIETYVISPEKPFRKTFIGKINGNSDLIILKISELNFETSMTKNRNGVTKIRIHGICDPINPEIGASLEEYINVKDIMIE